MVFGAFAAPIVYSFFFLIVLGSLGIKMERASELALGVQPDVMAGMVDCAAMGYANNAPNSTAAKGLAMAGYFPLACRAHPDRLFDVLSAYGEGIFYFLGVVSTIGVTLYFVTSSDSGSFVDDTLSAQGVYYLTLTYLRPSLALLYDNHRIVVVCDNTGIPIHIHIHIPIHILVHIHVHRL